MKNKAFQHTYAFSAVVGQELAKKAIVLNLINPGIGGVLLCGEKGSAKSTLVRSIDGISPKAKVINMPLNITEDRLIGTLDLEKTLQSGIRHFEAGLLAKVHEQILYVDEVNLLSESIVNALLEVSSSGINHIERDGFSMEHESKFILIGTMNPEEGPLRSQWLDRFGLFVQISGSNDLAERKEIVSRRLAYEADPAFFSKKYENLNQLIAKSIEKARQLLDSVKVTDEILGFAVKIATQSGAAGHRTELVLVETAKAIAAYDLRKHISLKDLTEAAELVLPHRKRDLQEPPEMDFDSEVDETDENEQLEDDSQISEEEQQQDNEQPTPELPDKQEEAQNSEAQMPPADEEALEDPGISDDQVDEIGRLSVISPLTIKLRDRRKRRGDGKRLQTKTDQKRGRQVKSIAAKDGLKDFAFSATLRAAAPYQTLRSRANMAIVIENSDYREKVREKRTGSNILFVVDASASMGVNKRMTAVKGAILSLLTDAYQKRDQVAMIAFRKERAEVILDLTRSVDLAYKSLQTLPTGGRTPLASGLSKAYDLIQIGRRKTPDMIPIVVLVSDGRTNVAIGCEDPYKEAFSWGKRLAGDGAHLIIVDTEQDFIKLELAKKLATELDCQYFKLEDLEGEHLAQAVRASIGS